MVGFHRHAVDRLADRHGGSSCQNLGQHAAVLWIEMLNEYEGKAGVGGQIGEQKLENFQPARGRPNAGHRDDCPGRSFFIHNHEIRWNIEPIYLRPDEVKKLTAAGLATFDRVAAIVEWLRMLLANGPVPSREVHEQARRQGIPYVLLFKAKAKARARAVRDGVHQRWCWELIPDDPPAPIAPVSPPAKPTPPSTESPSTPPT